MKHPFVVRVVGLVFLLTVTHMVPALADDGGFQSLFNGRDLTGWDGDLNVWSVEDGAITGRTTADDPIDQNTFLVWQGEPLKDFVLKLEYRVVDGNSGVQYRSRLLDADKWVVGGYQADIDAGPTYTGILYEEQGRGILAPRGQRVVVNRSGDRTATTFADAEELGKKVRQSDWNRYHIRARGNRLRHKINGQLMSDTIDRQADAKAASGILALQVHRGPPMKVQFRNVRLKRLNKAAKAKGNENQPDDRQSDKPQSAAPQSDEPHSAASQQNEPAEPKVTASATPTDALTLLPGFRAELLYSVPRELQGSWVAMTVDPQGRLIVSDQHGRLYRVTPPPIGGPPHATQVKGMDIELGMAQGLLWAHDSLYVVVNGTGAGGAGTDSHGSGLYRVQDSDGDGQLDDVRALRQYGGAGGEHGPHAVVLGPDGHSLFVVGGNHTAIPNPERSLVPRVWDEDQLLSRLWDASGHAVGILAPGGWICRTDPNGDSWELVSIGFRNPYDIAFNRHGDLFTFDADMEWDIGAPWYRPTRVCHVTSGSEFGWRSGTGKWPDYYPDSLPAMVDVGPGSPTGIAFGYGADFPPQYRDALFICDWSFGKLYAVHLQPRGATYHGELQDFVSGSPLPLTDVVVNPHDGALYFAIGGRSTQSGLYRVSYDGSSNSGSGETIAASGATNIAESRARPVAPAARLRRQLEEWHGRQDPAAIDAAWPHLDHADRFVRYAARVAVESQPLKSWQSRALAETRPQALIEAVVALARHADPQDEALRQGTINALGRLTWPELSKQQQLELLRAYSLVLIRLAPLAEQDRLELISRLDGHFPADDVDLNRELSQLLVYLDAERIVQRTLELLATAPTQEEQIHYVYALRQAIPHATQQQQRRYFGWFQEANAVRGGHSLRGFLTNISNDAAKQLTDQQRELLTDVLKPVAQENQEAVELPDRPVVKKYTVDEVVELANGGMHSRDYKRGRQLFGAALCFKCHRMGSEGGATGPDLTAAGHRFGTRDLVEAIVEPDKVISDRYRATTFLMDDGRVVTGRVANLKSDRMMVVTNMLAPGDLTVVRRDEIESMTPVATSEMPTGLLDTLKPDEILDLLTYVVSGGDADHRAFQKSERQGDLAAE